MTELRGVIGFCSYFRKFIPNFSGIVEILTDKTRKNTFYFEEAERTAFNLLKGAIKNSVLLTLPDFSKALFVHSDASDGVIGGVLLQKYEDTEKPIFFISRKLNPNDRNYTVIEKECLAIVWSIQQFKVFLMG